MMVLTMRALELKGLLGGSAADVDLNRYNDRYLISSYAKTSISALVKKGLVVGSNGLLNPMGNASRAEAAVLLYKIYNLT